MIPLTDHDLALLAGETNIVSAHTWRTAVAAGGGMVIDDDDEEDAA